MTHEETIKRIQELVPSVMALELGCEVKQCGITYMIRVDNPKVHICPNGSIGNLLIADKTSLVNYPLFDNLNKEDLIIEILGNPITLAVVLRALDESKNRSFVYCIEIKKWVETESNNAVRLFYIIATSWNLSKDNFNDQSEETKTYIGDLLSNQATD